MVPNRRHFIASILAGSAAAPLFGKDALSNASERILSAGPSTDSAQLLAILQQRMRTELAQSGAPGITLAVTTPAGFAATLTEGVADLTSKAPLTPDHLFYIGSLGKSLVALAAFRLADRKLLDLDAPVAGLMPELPDFPPGILVAHLLNHVSGLPGSAPLFPLASDGRLWTGPAPGTRFRYCNTGYDILGKLIAKLMGKPLREAMRDLVLTPLAMNTGRGAILNADKPFYATGHMPLYADRAFFAGAPVAPAPWVESEIGAGAIGATPGDMAAYLGFLGRAATGTNSALLSAPLLDRFLTPVVDAPSFGKGARYGNGLATVPVGRRSTLYHTGGTFSVSSALSVDRSTGFGCFASVNFGGTSYRPSAITRDALDALDAHFSGASIAGPTPAAAPVAGLGGAPEGQFTSRERGTMRFGASDSGGELHYQGLSVRIASIDDGLFATDHPLLAQHLIRFDPKRPDRVWWGPHPFGRSESMATPDVPDAFRPVVGRYRTNDPWWDAFTVIQQEGRLLLEGAGEIRSTPDGSWRFEDLALSAERLWFSHPLNGRMQRPSFSGVELARQESYDV